MRFQTGSEEGASRAPPCAAAGAQTTGGSVRIPRSTRANFQAARPPAARSPADLPADPVAIRIAASASGGGAAAGNAPDAVRVVGARQHVCSSRLDQFSRSAETWRARTAGCREASLLGGGSGAKRSLPGCANDRCRARSSCLRGGGSAYTQFPAVPLAGAIGAAVPEHAPPLRGFGHLPKLAQMRARCLSTPPHPRVALHASVIGGVVAHTA